MCAAVQRGALSWIAVWMLAVTPAAAQNLLPKGAEAELAKFVPATVKAKVSEVEPGKIIMESSTGDKYEVQVYDNYAEVEVTGTAKFEYLRTGVQVRFTIAEVDKKGNASGAMTDLTIYTHSDDFPPGVQSDDLEGKGGPWLVQGQIKTITKTGKATIAAGKTQVKVQFEESAEIKIACRDYAMAGDGDDIEVNGHIIEPPLTNGGKTTSGQMVAKVVEIKLAQPAGVPPKKTAKKPTKPGKGKPEKGGKPDKKKPDPFNQGDQ